MKIWIIGSRFLCCPTKTILFTAQSCQTASGENGPTFGFWSRWYCWSKHKIRGRYRRTRGRSERKPKTEKTKVKMAFGHKITIQSSTCYERGLSVRCDIFCDKILTLDFSALTELGFQWKNISYFKIRVRMANKNNPERFDKMNITLYKVTEHRIQITLRLAFWHDPLIIHYLESPLFREGTRLSFGFYFVSNWLKWWFS